MSLRPFLPRIRRIGRSVAMAAQWRRRALIACGLLAAMVWPGTLAGATVEDALTLIGQERYAEAQEVLDELLEQEPGAPGARLLLGVLQAREGKFIAAIEIFEDLRSDHPDMFEVHNNLAVLYAGLGRLDDAREALVAALELRPDHVVYDNLGDVYMRLAQRAYARAQEVRSGGVVPAEDGKAAAASTRPALPIDKPVASPAAAVATGEAGEPAAAASAQASDGECLRAGAFKNRARATEAAAWLRARDIEVLGVHPEDRQAVRRYRVYLPAAASRKEAVATAQELRRQGVRNVMAIEEGPLANTVSLGLFRQESNMRRRVAELDELGYDAVSEADMTTVTEYAIEVRAEGGRSAFADAWASRYPDHAIRPVACVVSAQPAEPAEPPAAVTAATAPQSDAACIRTGAFAEGGAATEAAAWLRSRGAAAVEVRREERETVDNRRLYLPAPPSRKETVATVNELRSRGVRDVAIIQRGPLAGAVSLGVYRNESNIRRRITELQKLGYSVEVVANMKTVTTYTLEARVDEDRSTFDVAWKTAFPDHAIQTVACAPQE